METHHKTGDYGILLRFVDHLEYYCFYFRAHLRKNPFFLKGHGGDHWIQNGKAETEKNEQSLEMLVLVKRRTINCN